MAVFPLFNNFQYGYFPRGPVIEGEEAFAALKKEIDVVALQERLIFCRMDPEHPLNIPHEMKISKSFSPQPEVTLILDLNKSESTLLKEMKRKGRYNIALAEKKGVKIQKANGREQRSSFSTLFYRLLKKTSARDQFSMHEEQYYKTLIEKVPEAEIFVAFLNDVPLAAGIFCFQGQQAIYYYGASDHAQREVMAPYRLQWEAICEAKRRGCTTYDFLGIAPESSRKSHPWAGITEFKKKFGGMVVSSPTPMDLIYLPGWYKVYRGLKFLQSLTKKIF